MITPAGNRKPPACRRRGEVPGERARCARMEPDPEVTSVGRETLSDSGTAAETSRSFDSSAVVLPHPYLTTRRHDWAEFNDDGVGAP